MRNYPIPDYYTDETMTEEEKLKLDWEMVAADFPNKPKKSYDNTQ